MIIRGENSGPEPDTDQRMFRVMITGLETPEELECYCRTEDRALRNRVPILSSWMIKSVSKPACLRFPPLQSSGC